MHSRDRTRLLHGHVLYALGLAPLAARGAYLSAGGLGYVISLFAPACYRAELLPPQWCNLMLLVVYWSLQGSQDNYVVFHCLKCPVGTFKGRRWLRTRSRSSLPLPWLEWVEEGAMFSFPVWVGWYQLRCTFTSRCVFTQKLRSNQLHMCCVGLYAVFSRCTNMECWEQHNLTFHDWLSIIDHAPSMINSRTHVASCHISWSVTSPVVLFLYNMDIVKWYVRIQ